jgi:hypothetical protein
VLLPFSRWNSIAELSDVARPTGEVETSVAVSAIVSILADVFVAIRPVVGPPPASPAPLHLAHVATAIRPGPHPASGRAARLESADVAAAPRPCVDPVAVGQTLGDRSAVDAAIEPLENGGVWRIVRGEFGIARSRFAPSDLSFARWPSREKPPGIAITARPDIRSIALPQP